MYKKTLPALMAAAALATLTTAPASAGTAAIVEIRDLYSVSVYESQNIRFTCNYGFLMLGREHHDDENGITTYRCGNLYINGIRVIASATPGLDWNLGRKESDSRFVAPADMAIVGRHHDGDENGNTAYRVANLSWQGKRVSLTHPVWGPRMRESNHSVNADPGQVMTGRRHDGDENGDTFYQFSTVVVSG